MNEKLLEKKLREGIKLLGGMAIKIYSPSFTGLPDRMVLMPRGRVWFAEIKTTGESLRPRQTVVRAFLEKLGFVVFVIDTQEKLTAFLGGGAKMIYEPRPYQQHGEEHVIRNPYGALFMGMGLGKTVTTLTAISKLIFDYFEVTKVLVIAPLHVAETVWHTEATKWDHLRHLTFSLILGPERERKEALRTKADIYVINRENVAWLIAFLGGAFPFDMVVIDELDSFKSAKAVRFKALRQVRPRVNRVVGLTGTPAPNGLLDLWPQMYLLDRGERLGKTLTSYRDKYFKAGRRNGYIVYNYELPKDDGLLGGDIWQKEIYEKIGDICISVKEEDWLTLPPLIEQDVQIQLPASIKAQYDEFEKKQVLALEENEITAINAAVLSNKLRQFANGAIYTAKDEYYEVHNAKIEALEEDLEAANGEPFLLFYQYKHDLERIMKYLKKFKPKKLEGSGDIFDWNKRKLPFMLAHPASAGHGLNLQDGGNFMGWFGLDWNLGLYQQANKRIHRPGVKSKVFMRRYLVKGTIDEDVLLSLNGKADGQEALLQAVKARIMKYRA